MTEKNKYQIAKEVWDEFYSDDEGNTNFIRFIEKKMKPVDPLKEKLNSFLHWNVHGTDGLNAWEKFKEIFKDDLNGTKVLEKVEEGLVSLDNQGTSLPPEVFKLLRKVRRGIE